MKMNLRVFAVLALLFLALQGIQPARAQPDAREVLRGVILQFQTGTPNPLWYGQELWRTAAMQTGNTGVYPLLRQLGPVQNIRITEQLPLPTGMLYAMTASHQNGQSNWHLGISSITNRIEYARFEVGQAAQPLPSPGPAQPLPSQGPTPSPRQPDPSTAETSAACKKFPNLC
jgi:hypothetical protein